uniref:Uncharacterized protein n=1 Tax=Anguilla anguilla TaxID=7936 RepID=A0A0E9VJJ1_ANGAN
MAQSTFLVLNLNFQTLHRKKVCSQLFSFIVASLLMED